MPNCFQSCYIYFPTSILPVAIASLILDIDRYFKIVAIMVDVDLSPLDFLSTNEVSISCLSIFWVSFSITYLFKSFCFSLFGYCLLRILKTLSFTYVQNPSGICFYLWHKLGIYLVFINIWITNGAHSICWTLFLVIYGPLSHV